MTSLTQPVFTPANEPQLTLTVADVPDALRIHFWPQHFGTIPQWLML